jgi:putative photosynthetic complex assembly protein
MSDPFGNKPFARGPLLGAAVLLGSVLVGTALVRLTGVGGTGVADAPSVVEKDFHFEDRSDGSIAVIESEHQHLIYTVPPGTNGFLRGTLRGLARERKREGLGSEAPFQLIGRADGRLTLIDPATRRRVDLESFGPTNAAVFARLLELASSVPLAASTGALHEQ